MGEIVEMDCKGRITIPSKIRKIVGKTKFRIELMDRDTIILRTVKEKNDVIKKILSLELLGDEERSSIDAASIKDLYGGIKY